MDRADAPQIDNSTEQAVEDAFDAPALARLVQSLESRPDQEFHQKVVKEAAGVVGADMVFISRLNEGTSRMRSLALYDGTGQLEQMVYDLKGTPCEQVVARGEACAFPTSVAAQFPEDHDLIDLGIEGYVAVPLIGIEGNVLGLFCTLFRSEVESPEFVISLLQLFSARIASEIERAEAEARVKLALAGSADGIWDWDIDTDRVYFSPDFFLRQGLKEEDLPTTLTEWQAWGHPDDLAAAQAAVRRHFKDDAPYDVKYRFRCGDDKYRWVRLKGQVQRDEDGRATRMLGSLSDIDELVRAQIDAEKANEAKSLFLANMSHEIRTPMNAIMGMLQVLEGSQVDGEQREWIGTASSAATSLLAILNDILDLSRLEAGKVEIEPARIAVREFVADVEHAYVPLADKKLLRCFVTIDKEVPSEVETDPGRLRQILSNLLSNAIKFTSVGEVELKLSVVGGKDTRALRFSVCDTGIGIADATRKRLFERFEQGDNSTTRQYGGAGLGLAICSELAMRLGGMVGVDSELGKGSCFWFQLPLGEDVERETPVSQSEDQNAIQQGQQDKPLNGVKVLIAEDHPTNQRILQLLMSAFGAEVALVADGIEAVETVQKQSFDLVLMDVSMPRMDGYEATRALRALDGPASEVAIIAVTAHAMGGELEKALAVGMNGYVSKPIEASNLIASIQSVLSEVRGE